MRYFTVVLAMAVLGVGVGWTTPIHTEEPIQDQKVLYNGVRLPKDWPPRMEKLTRTPMPVPYLEHPPEVVPIDTGRQLLVDDFLVAQTNLQRTFYQAQYHPACPVLKPDKPWEKQPGPPRRVVRKHCAQTFPLTFPFIIRLAGRPGRLGRFGGKHQGD